MAGRTASMWAGASSGHDGNLGSPGPDYGRRLTGAASDAMDRVRRRVALRPALETYGTGTTLLR